MGVQAADHNLEHLELGICHEHQNRQVLLLKRLCSVLPPAAPECARCTQPAAPCMA